MYPEELALYNFVYKKPRYEFFPTLIHRKIDNIYVWDAGYANAPRNMKKLLVGAVFINEYQAYKIVSLDKGIRNAGGYTRAIHVEIYSDVRVKLIIDRIKTIKEHLLVYADNIEERGSLYVAEQMRFWAHNIIAEYID